MLEDTAPLAELHMRGQLYSKRVLVAAETAFVWIQIALSFRAIARRVLIVPSRTHLWCRWFSVRAARQGAIAISPPALKCVYPQFCRSRVWANQIT